MSAKFNFMIYALVVDFNDKRRSKWLPGSLVNPKIYLQKH